MSLNEAYFEARYREMSAEELARLNASDLGEVAQACYQREMARRESPEYKREQSNAAQKVIEEYAAETKRCFFCGSEQVGQENAARVKMFTGLKKTYQYRKTLWTWTPGVTLVSRCERCRRAHHVERTVRIVAGLLGVPLILVAALFVFAYWSRGSVSTSSGTVSLLFIATPIIAMLTWSVVSA